jgi:hypothetical protein
MPTLRRWPIGYLSCAAHRRGLHLHAHRLTAAEHPDQAARLILHGRPASDTTRPTAYHQARRQPRTVSHQPLYDTSATELIPDLTDEVAAAQHRVASTDQRVATLASDPAITSHPDPGGLLNCARAAWHTEQILDYQQPAFRPIDPARSIRHEPYPTPQIDHGRSIGL